MNQDDNKITQENASIENTGEAERNTDLKHLIQPVQGAATPTFSTNIETHDTDEVYTHKSSQIEQEPSKDTVVSDPNSYQQAVTWLPAMMGNSDNHGSSFVLDQTADSNRAANELLAHGTFVQLPSSYAANSNKQIYGLMLGTDTLVPIDSLSLLNFHTGYGKLDQSGNICSGDADINETIQGLVKGERDVSNEGEPYASLPAESSLTKEDLYCIYCPKLYKTINELQAHIMIDHPEQTQLSSFISDTGNMHPSLRTCLSCGGQLRRMGGYDQEFTITGQEEENSLQLHHAPNILMVCQTCFKEYTLGLAPENTTNISHIQAAKRHFCDHCDKSYKHNRDLRKHLRTHHGYDNNTTQISQSSEAFASTSSTQANYQNGPAPHSTKMVCQQCKKMFRGPFELRRHIHTVHENKRPYKCPECNKFFRDAYELKRHSASHQRVHYHSSTSANISVDHSQPMDLLHIQSTTESQGVQGNSGSHMSSGTLFRDVYNTGHASAYVTSQQGSLDYYCGTCEKNFRGANEFKRHHSVVHEKKYRYKCIHCGKLWRDQYDLKRHCRRSHFVDRDIDRSFIRQCLLDNSNNNTDNTTPSQNPLSISNYDLGQPMTLTFNQETAAALFGTSEHDMHGTSGQMDANFSLVDHGNFGGNQMNLTSQADGMFQNMSSIQSASMLYPTDNSSHLVENIIGSQDNEAMHEESKAAVNWSNFESDIQSEK